MASARSEFPSSLSTMANCVRRLGLLGTGITSITPGAGGVTLQDAPMGAAASPLSQALGFGLMGADIYGRIFRPTGS